MADTDGTTKNKTSRRSFWQKHLRAWFQSGLTQADYCRQHELSRAAFGWWKRQLQGKPKPRRRSPGTKRHHSDHPATVQFVEVQHGPDRDLGGSPAVYEILLSCGRAIRVGHTFDAAVLKRLITTVEALC